MAPLVVRQFDICRNPDRASRARVPYLIVLQSDLLMPLETVVVAPVVPERAASIISKLNPALTMDGKPHRVLIQELAGVPKSRLGAVAANASDQRGEFIAAVDLLFTGF